jgi:hypothetical protein
MATIWTPDGEKPFVNTPDEQIQIDWQEYDWKEFNPSNDLQQMNYSEYHRRRLLPKTDDKYIPAPTLSELLTEVRKSPVPRD